MRRRLLACLGLVVLCFAACSSKEPAAGVAKQPAAAVAKDTAAAKSFPDEPAAHALYNQMIEAMRKADSLSYVCHYSETGGDVDPFHGVYQVWLKKPNFFRIEDKDKGEDGKPGSGGVLIGDGEDLWVYWTNGRPRVYEEEMETYEKTRLNRYMTKPAPPGGHSIAHETRPIGAGLMILDPSAFHGYTDCLQGYLDGITSLPAEKVGDDDCDGIEVSIMKHQRSWYLWLSKADHLPRKMKEIVRVSYDIIVEEQWMELAINADIPNSLFAWKPPEGWVKWDFPKSADRMLKPGTQGPDFQLASADGKPIKLSDYRGKVVWFYIWRAG